MNNTTELIDRYIEIWNETDQTRRRELIAQTWSDSASYIDPLMHAEGRDGIDAMVNGVQSQFPGLRFRRTSNVDEHNNRVRFAWELGPVDGAAVAGGVDFGVLADGHLHSITGFLDFAPSSEAGR